MNTILFIRSEAPFGNARAYNAQLRASLPGSERKMAVAWHASLNEELLTLAADPEIFTGHQAGSACGAGLSGKRSRSIGFERRWNRSRSLDAEASIDAIAVSVPSRLAGIDRTFAATAGA